MLFGIFALILFFIDLCTGFRINLQLILWIVIIGIFISALRDLYNKKQHERYDHYAYRKDRSTIPCAFDNGISREQFRNVVNNICSKSSFRITGITIENAIVYCTVHSMTQKTQWHFRIDFNDNGHLTGAYHITSDNHNSTIPAIVANQIEEQIRSLLNTI